MNRKAGNASHLVAVLEYAICGKAQYLSLVESVSITVVSLDLLTDSLKKCLLLVGRQEVERAGERP